MAGTTVAANVKKTKKDKFFLDNTLLWDILVFACL
jgi:hypothetical protein